MVLVEPPMAMSSVMAFSKALKPMERGSTVVSSFRSSACAQLHRRRPARLNSCSRSACGGHHGAVAGQRQAQASVRQFIELAVNMPEQEPQVGQAERSTSATSASLTALSSAAITMASIQVELLNSIFGPWVGQLDLASLHGPPRRNTTGMFQAHGGHQHAGVILSQLEMHTMASAQCALTMYSTESAMMSRLGSEYSMPSWPMAMPSSTAMVLNSLATPPAASISRATSWPRS